MQRFVFHLLKTFAAILAGAGLSTQLSGSPRTLVEAPQAPAAPTINARVIAAVSAVQALPGTSRVGVSSVRPAATQLSTWILTPSDPADSRIIIEAFGQPIVISPDKIESRPGGALAWFGRVESVGGFPGMGTAVLALREGMVGGMINIPGREIHIYPAVADRIVLREVNMASAIPDHSPEFRSAPPSSGPVVRAIPVTATGPIEISILFSVSRSAELKLRTMYPSIQKAVDDAIEKANASFINSVIDIRFVSAGIHHIQNYQETDRWEEDRDAFFAHAGAKAQRRAVKADIGVLIADSESFCGEVQAINADAATALTIIEWSCLAGGFTLAHEVGHLFGAEHDPSNAGDPPAYSYGHGYFVKYADDDLSWRDIMSYDDPCFRCMRIPYWSSPLKSYPPNTVGAANMGSATKFDNARVLRENASKVAKFGDQL